MESLLSVAAIMLAQTPQEPDPSVVTPGLLGLALTLALGVAIFFLFKSMNRQLKKVDFPEPEGDNGPDEQQPPS